MGVHVNSVFDVSINNFDSALYTSITDKEEYLYDVSTLGEAFYKPFVLDLNAAIATWMATSWNSGNVIQDLITGIYGTKAITNLFGGSPVAPDSRTLFSMNGWRASIQTQPIDYWDDGVPPAPGTAPQLELDTLLVTNSVTIDQASISATVAQAQAVLSAGNFSNLFEDIPFANPPLTKQDLGTFIFNTLHYAEVFQNLDVGGLTLPSYI